MLYLHQNSLQMDKIKIIGAKENNLKNIDVEIPHNQLTIVTGLSGSGKSSLVRDILQREGQRMYLETISAYSRSKFGKIRPAKITDIHGLLPVISVGQTHVQANRRSTAGTFSDISPLFRQLFSRFNDQNEKIPRNAFSFNSEKGWCPHCTGLGIEEYIDISKLIADPKRSLRDGALVITLPNGYTIYSQVTIDELQKVCTHHGFSVDMPWNTLSTEQKDIILNGSTEVKVLYGKHSLESRMKWTGMTAKPREEGYYKGIIPVMEDILKRDRNDNILRFVSAKTCTECNGERIGQMARTLTWNGIRYPELEKKSFNQILSFFKTTKLDTEAERQLVKSILQRLMQLSKLSIGHIAPIRLSETLSQGELRRMHLAQLNHSGLTGVLYLFDEPSIGLHMRDVGSLIETFYKLINKGNTVVVVEHNEQIIRAAQHIIELGPGAGKYGGKIIINDSIPNIQSNIPQNSLLNNILNPISEVPKQKKHKPETFKIEINSANNIIDQCFEFAKQQINVITGVSGAGKSTLVNHGLLKTDTFEQIIFINQKPIGRTSRSNPATYTGMFDELRKLFAQTEKAKSNGFKAGHFSFNNKQGQCEACLGTGTIKTGMHIFEDLIQECPVCKGTRYKKEILEINIKGKNIAQILDMSVLEALSFFKENPKLSPFLIAMQKLGLDYLHLGQSSTTLSGGEAQRIKLASELHKKTKQNTLYVLDEPTSGLHNENISMLLTTLKQFIHSGHTIVLVEHESQVIKNANWVIDIGPEGGENGGKNLFCGSVIDFLSKHTSPTTRSIKSEQKELRIKTQYVHPNIELKDITTNNLKHIDIQINTNEIIAFTGASGSGKTSLLIDTLHSEGQRLFLENLSSYKRLQIKMNTSARVKQTKNMIPTVAVTADELKPNIHSTAASLSGLYDFMRLLYARFADKPNNNAVTAADFSLHNEYSVCPSCEGTGFEKKCLPEKIIQHGETSILNDATLSHKTTDYYLSKNNKYRWILIAMAKDHLIDLTIPWNKLGDKDKEKILFGTDQQTYKATWQFERKNNKGVHQFNDTWKGLCNLIEEEYKIHYPSTRGKNALELLSDIPCNTCNGNRLNKKMLQYTFEGMHMGEALKLSITEFYKIIKNAKTEISAALKKQLIDKLGFLQNAGLNQIPLGRPAQWLSTGELKWIKLSQVLSSSLSGMCIILDEPAAGMDTKARMHLTNALLEAKKRGNTILLSDHHKEVIQIADRVIEMGPESGIKGGKIVSNINPKLINKSNAPIANEILAEIIPDKRKRERNTEKITYKDLSFYTNRLNLIYGKTGSGKSTLLEKIYTEFNTKDNILFIKSSPISNNNQSLVGTRTTILNDLKKQFAKLQKSKSKGYVVSDFGFNNKKTQCSVCKGKGYKLISLDFMPNIKETCEECYGSRYKPEILQFTIEDKNIAQWLKLTIEELYTFKFWSKRAMAELELLIKVGLGYLSANRETSSLSEGEQRRLALAEELVSLQNAYTIILFDNPSSGLDPLNTKQLWSLFDQLIDMGHTIIIADEERYKESVDYSVKRN
jgi:excinuclease ABC subunit A